MKISEDVALFPSCYPQTKTDVSTPCRGARCAAVIGRHPQTQHEGLAVGDWGVGTCWCSWG